MKRHSLWRVKKEIRNKEEFMKVGITEAGDAGLDFSWVDSIYPINIVVTKHLTAKNSKLIDGLINMKDRVILHCTCTGYGGTKMEPHVPTPTDIHAGVMTLIQRGFPVEQIVLRTDPIIPTEKGIKRAIAVWDLFKDTGITRCRYSVIDMYKHTKERILSEYGKLPFETFSAPDYMMENVRNAVINYNGSYSFEACAENLPVQTGCVSIKDFQILGVDTSDIQIGGFQRKGCQCIAGKTELLTSKKRCTSGCLYCYWKD